MIHTLLVLNALAHAVTGGSIQGHAWLDKGAKMPSLAGLAGVEVELLSAGKVVARTKTTSSGSFKFIALVNGAYSVRAVPPLDKYFTNTADGTWGSIVRIQATSDRISGVDFKMKTAEVSENLDLVPFRPERAISTSRDKSFLKSLWQHQYGRITMLRR